MTGPSEGELRAIVRDVIARRIAATPSAVSPEAHASHQMLPVGRGGDGACLIEPAVRCAHCGYCLSYGH